MKRTLGWTFIFICLLLPVFSRAQDQFPRYFQNKSRLVGELALFNIKAEFNKVNSIKASFIGLDNYYKNFGFGTFLVRYSNVTDGNGKFIEEYGIWEFFPIRLSFIPLFSRGAFMHRHNSDSGEPLLFWNSVSPGQYAKFYIRLFGEASFAKFLSRWQDEYNEGFHSWDPPDVNRYRKIGKMYPPTLSAGLQINFTLLSLEGGYVYQTKKWHEFLKHGYLSDPDGFSFTGPYFSLNLSLGGILIGPSKNTQR